MRQEGLVPCQSRPFRITTHADAQAAAAMPDLVKRDFTADRPGITFVGDITYIHTWQRFIYLGMRSSMGQTGVCWDNAMAESFFSSLKNERVYRTVYATKAHARSHVIAYIEGFYNSRCRHCALDYKRPNEVLYSYTKPALAA